MTEHTDIETALRSLLAQADEAIAAAGGRVPTIALVEAVLHDDLRSVGFYVETRQGHVFVAGLELLAPIRETDFDREGYEFTVAAAVGLHLKLAAEPLRI